MVSLTLIAELWWADPDAGGLGDLGGVVLFEEGKLAMA
jgi:hypothetical protein